MLQDHTHHLSADVPIDFHKAMTEDITTLAA
jgi:hypothetical protein